MKIKFDLQDFSPIEEGERLLTITDVKCTPSGKPTQMDVTFQEVGTKKILKNKYNFTNSGGLMAMGFLCRIALELPDMTEFDTNDCSQLVGKTLKCEIVHTKGTQPREDGSFPIFANIKKIISLVKPETTNLVVDNVNTSPRASISIGDDLD